MKETFIIDNWGISETEFTKLVEKFLSETNYVNNDELPSVFSPRGAILFSV